MSFLPIKAFHPPASLDADPVSLLAERNWRAELGLSEQAEKDLFRAPEGGPVIPGSIQDFPARSPEEDRAFLKQFWRSAFLEEEATLDSTLPFRVRVGWRIVREMARLKNLVDENEMLAGGLPWAPCPWTNPTSFFFPADPSDMKDQKRYMSSMWDVVQLVTRSPKDPGAYPGLPLLPPFPPFGSLADPDDPNEEVLPEKPYQPIEDQGLMSWIKAAKRISEHYSMEFSTDDRGRPELYLEGRLGLSGILDPVTCRRAFPSRQQIEAFEDMIVSEVITKLQEGREAAQAHLRKEYGLHPREIKGVMAMALTELRGRCDIDIEEKRSLMEHRLERVAERAGDALDLNSELKALKVLTVVQGLTRTEPEDMGREMVEAMQRVSNSTPQDTPELRVIEVPVKE
jgi:hypothetical protein